MEEPVGKSSAAMTEAKASRIRADRIRGKEAPNTVKRKELLERRCVSDNKYTLQNIGEQYVEVNAGFACQQRQEQKRYILESTCQRHTSLLKA